MINYVDNNNYTLIPVTAINKPGAAPSSGVEVYCKVNTEASADVYLVRIQTNGSFG